MTETSLTAAPLPPAAPPTAVYIPDTWEKFKASGLKPRVASQGRSTEAQRKAFEMGFKLLDLGDGPKPQQLHVVDCISAGTRYAAILLPRQSAKTSTIETYLLGLCLQFPGIQIAYSSGSTGKFARDHFSLKVVKPLEGMYPDADTRPFKIRKGGGQERLEFHNGSLYKVCATADDFRGHTFDIVWVDEAGELEGDDKNRLLDAATPTQNTRAGIFLETPLLIFSGTAGISRKGNALWDFLELGRAEDEDVSILEYSAGVDLTIEDYETWELAEPLILKSHPAIGNLTPLSIIKGEYKTKTKVGFGREYLGIFTDTTNTQGILNPGKWAAAELNVALPMPPERFAFGMATHRQQTSGAIAAAWRDENGIARVLIIDHQEGVDWLPEKVKSLHVDYPKKAWVHDSKGTVLTEVSKLQKMARPPRLQALSSQDVATAAALFTKEVHTSKLKHYGQAHLSEAALIAKRREYGKAFFFGTPELGQDITALEAASMALWAYDELPERKALPRMF